MRVVGLVGVMALQSRATFHLQRRSRLDKLAGKAVGLMYGVQAGLPVGWMVVATRDVPMGLPVGLLVDTLELVTAVAWSA
jgi:hypothetical protein